MERGAIVTMIALQGQRYQRRVWEDLGEGVLICSEDEYQRARQEEDEPLYVGFPRADVIAGADDEED